MLLHKYTQPIIKDKVIPNNTEHAAKMIDKGKQKLVGIWINEPMITTKNTLVMSKLRSRIGEIQTRKRGLS